jgi:hypothetical protein
MAKITASMLKTRCATRAGAEELDDATATHEMRAMGQGRATRR